MPSLTSLGTALAAASAVSAHGWIDVWTIAGQDYTGYNPTIAPWEADQGTIAWPAYVDSLLMFPFPGSRSAPETIPLSPNVG